MKLLIAGKEIDLDKDAIEQAIKNNEDLKIEGEFILRSKEEDAAYTENLKKEQFSIAAEIGRKELIKGLGIEGEAIHKKTETSLEAINNLINSRLKQELESAKIEPNKKVDELSKDLETAKLTIQNLTKTVSEKENEFTSKMNEYAKRDTIMAFMPDGLVLPKDQIYKLISEDIKIEVRDGVKVALNNNGDVIKDPTTLNPVPVNEVITNYFNTNTQFLKPTEGGRGEGKDSGGTGGKKTIEQFMKEQSDLGISPNSEQFNASMTEQIKSGILEV